MKILFSLITLLFILTACTNNNAKPSTKTSTLLSEITGQDGLACISTSRIRGYAATQKTINIDAGRKFFIATTLYRCQNLDLAPHALFDSRFSEVCGGGRASIVTREGRCPIQKIYEFDDKKAAFAALDDVEKMQKEMANK